MGMLMNGQVLAACKDPTAKHKRMHIKTAHTHTSTMTVSDRSALESINTSLEKVHFSPLYDIFFIKLGSSVVDKPWTHQIWVICEIPLKEYKRSENKQPIFGSIQDRFVLPRSDISVFNRDETLLMTLKQARENLRAVLKEIKDSSGLDCQGGPWYTRPKYQEMCTRNPNYEASLLRMWDDRRRHPNSLTHHLPFSPGAFDHVP